MTVKPLIEHLDELRKRIILVLIFFFFIFFIGFFISNIIIERVVNDLIIAENIKLVVLTPLEFIYAQIKVGFLMALMITSPLIIYQLLLFVKPALTKREKKAISLILPSFVVLFLAGSVFAYFIFLPLSLYFLANLASFNVLNMWSLNKFISFVFITALSFGLVFQTPLIMLLLHRLNIVNIEILKKQRKAIYVLIFVIAAIITPGVDFFSQIIVAVPLIILYELSLLFVRMFK